MSEASVLKCKMADTAFDAIKDRFTVFDHPVEVTRVGVLRLQIKVLTPDRPPRYFTLQISENI